MGKPFDISRITVFYDYKFEPDYEFSGHTHFDWEINLILDGEMSITIADRVFTGRKGDLFVVSPWIFHYNHAMSGGASMIVAQFLSDESEYPDFMARSLTDEEFGAAGLMVSEFRKLGFATTRAGCAAHEADLINPKKLLEVLLSLDGENHLSGAQTRRAELYTDAVEVMRQSVSEKMTISEFAKRLHVSPTVLKKAFSATTGKGVMEYFMELKISEAQRLIGEGKSLSYISDHLGFSSQCYFSTVYRRVMGVTPAGRAAAHHSKGRKC